MKLIYQFTPEERQVIARAREKYFAVVQVVLDLHPELKGNLTLADDLSGLVEQGQPGTVA